MNSLKRVVLVFVVLATAASAAFAGGFQINEHGAKAMGMGGAFVAQADDPSAIFFNPAGLGFQPGLRAMLGATIILPSTKWTNPNYVTGPASEEMESQVFYPPNAYVTYGLANGLTFGIGVYAPYGLGTEWPEVWEGSRLAVKADLQSIYINPSIAYKLNDCLSIGVGFSYVTSTVNLKQRIALSPTLPSANDGILELDADGNSYDFSAGILYKRDVWSIGASYRHSAEIDYEGTATFSNMGGFATFFPGGTGSTTITMPNQAWIGASVTPTPNFTLEADIQWIGWSTYDTLAVNIPVGPPTPPPPLGTGRPLQGPSKAAKDWFDTFIARLGAEYRLDKIALRGGLVYDYCPQPARSVEPLLPDADRFEFSLGLGFDFTKNLGVDVAYQMILFNDRTVTSPPAAFAGTYESTAHLIGLDLRYGF